jgi:hypothetical protein
MDKGRGKDAGVGSFACTTGETAEDDDDDWRSGMARSINAWPSKTNPTQDGSEL